MHYIEAGSGFPLLLGHSYLFDHRMWKPQMEELAKRYRLIVPDLWGHGSSPELPPQHESLSDIANDFLTLVDRLGLREFGIIGLSVGGMWGAELAAMCPDRVRALVLMDTYLGAETPDAREKYFSMLNAVDLTGAIVSPLLEYIAQQFYSDHVPEALLSALTEHLQQIPADRLHNSIVPLGKMIFGREDKRDLLKEITCPSVVITGEEDKPRPPSEGAEMASLLNCNHIIIPGAGHICNLEKPAEVTAVLIRVLENLIPHQGKL